MRTPRLVLLDMRRRWSNRLRGWLGVDIEICKLQGDLRQTQEMIGVLRQELKMTRISQKEALRRLATWPRLDDLPVDVTKPKWVNDALSVSHAVTSSPDRGSGEGFGGSRPAEP